MKTIITYGTFDLFHVGHVRLLKRLKESCDKLVVGLSTDSFNKLKGKSSFFSYEERAEILRACKYVDIVFPENDWEQKKHDIVNYSANIFAIGDDWKGEFDYLAEFCEVLYLPRTEDVSTTEIKRKLAKITNEDLIELEQSLHNVFEIVQSISQK